MYASQVNECKRRLATQPASNSPKNFNLALLMHRKIHILHNKETCIEIDAGVLLGMRT